MLVPLWVVWRTKSSIGGGGSASAGQARTSPPARTSVWSFRVPFFAPAPWGKKRKERVECIQAPGDADDPGHVDAGVPANLPVPEKIEPGLRRARVPWSGTVGSVELVAELHEHLAPDRAVCAPEERIRVERIVLRVQLVEDVVHEQADRGVVRDLLLDVGVPDDVRSDASGLFPVRQRAPAVAVDRSAPIVLGPGGGPVHAAAEVEVLHVVAGIDDRAAGEVLDVQLQHVRPAEVQVETAQAIGVETVLPGCIDARGLYLRLVERDGAVLVDLVIVDAVDAGTLDQDQEVLAAGRIAVDRDTSELQSLMRISYA